MKNTILFVSHEASRTGAPICLLNVLRWLRQNTRLPFRVLLKQGGPLEEDFRQVAPTDLLSQTRLSQAYFDDIGLIYSNTCVNGLLLKALPLRGIPVITHFHELDFVIDGFGAENIAAVKEQTTHYIACAESVAEGMRSRQGIPADRISVAYEAIPVSTVAEQASQAQRGRRDFQIADDDFLILGCGTAEGRKGTDLFLQLAGILRRKATSTRKLVFRWVGSMPEDDRAKLLRSDVRRLGLADCIKFVGLQANPYPLLSACDLFCLPSREDPFPLVMLEAAALRKPMVCFAGSGGAEEFCGQGGGLAAPYLDVEAMSRHCLELIGNDELRRQIGEAAARAVQARHDINVLAPRILEILRPWLKSSDAQDIQIPAKPVCAQPKLQSVEIPVSVETVALPPAEPAAVPDTAIVETEQTLWLNDESLSSLEKRLTEKPRMIGVVSFDFFDTLVNRLCAEPTDVFIEVGRRLAARGLLRQAVSPVEFKHARMAAEERARKASHAKGRSLEIKLADIYAQLHELITEIPAAQEVELEVERVLCYLNPSTVSLVRFVRSQGHKTAVISDTYLSADQLRLLLNENGCDPSLFDAVFASSEWGCSKGDGGLYHKVCGWFDIHANELLHIGDNPHTDVRAAMELGADAAHYYRTNVYHDEIFCGERDLRGNPAAYTDSPGASLNSMRVMASRLARDPDDSFRDGAFVCGPVLARYADWCAGRFAAAGVKTVLALMREGETLGELLREAARFARHDLNVVLCYASRMATAYPAMEEITVENLDALGIPPGVTLKAILEILGIVDEAALQLSHEQLFAKLNSAAAVHSINRFLVKDPKLRALIESRCAQQHQLAFEYVTSLIGNDTTFGILDLGWSGTIQRNIGRILRKGGRKVHTVGCYLAATPPSARMFLDGDEAHGYLDLTRVPVLSEVAEVAVTSCIGSTKGYARAANGQVLPVLAANPIGSGEAERKQRIREGIQAFQVLWLDYRRCKGDGINSTLLAEIDSQSAAILLRWIEYPTKPEADRLGGFHHDESFYGYSRQLCDWRAEDHLEQHGAFMLLAKKTCFWPQGVIARHSPRSVLALSRQWRHSSALGRLGAERSAEGQAFGITDEELAMLLDLLRTWNPQQVIYGAVSADGAKAISRLMAELAVAHPESASPASLSHPPAPRIVVLGLPNPDRSFTDGAEDMACVEGDPATLMTLRKVRALMQGGGRTVLVLTDRLPIAAIRGMLNCLAPHLGEEGIVVANHGRFDLAHIETEQPLTQVLGAWQREHGAELGYQFAPEPNLCGQANYNWTILSRSPAEKLGEDYWAFTLPSLTQNAPSERVLLKS